MVRNVEGHVYKGRAILPYERDGYRWYIQTYNETGTPWDGQYCPHFHTLSEAREWVDWKDYGKAKPSRKKASPRLSK